MALLYQVRVEQIIERVVVVEAKTAHEAKAEAMSQVNWLDSGVPTTVHVEPLEASRQNESRVDCMQAYRELMEGQD